jgi:pimeloyl-ACP methyl ester carboxylesterase
MQLSANGVALEVDDQGPASAPALLLIMGLGMQLIAWPDELVRDLLRRGFRVVRFDNRDAGLSQGFDHLGTPSVVAATLRHLAHLPVHSPYTLADMAADALGVMDALGLARAHVCGASLGGMVAQHLAARHPDRVSSLTLMMTTSGSRRLPQATMAASRALLQRPTAQTLEARIDNLADVMRVIGSPGYPPEPAALRDRLERSLRRAYRPAGVIRQLVAVAADGDRTALLSQIRAPTQVIHGAEDPLVPAAAGKDLVQRIAGAQGDFIPGMGHDLPVALLPRFAQALAANAERAGR